MNKTVYYIENILFMVVIIFCMILKASINILAVILLLHIIISNFFRYKIEKTEFNFGKIAIGISIIEALIICIAIII